MFYLNLNAMVNEESNASINLSCSGSIGSGQFKEILERSGNQISMLIAQTAEKLPENMRHDFVMGCACALNKALMDQVESYETVK